MLSVFKFRNAAENRQKYPIGVKYINTLGFMALCITLAKSKLIAEILKMLEKENCVSDLIQVYHNKIQSYMEQ